MDLIEKIKILTQQLQAQNFEYVIQGCKTVLKKDPENVYVYNLCGLAHQGKRNILSAIPFFKRALELQPNNLPAMNNLANSYKALGVLDKAEKLYTDILKINPNYIQALNNFGNLKQNFNDFKGAIELYEKALKIKNMDINLSLSLATAYQGTGDFKKAYDICTKILETNPKSTSTHKLITSFTKYTKNDKHLFQMKELIKDENLLPEQIIDLSFALGKAYEDIGDYENSFVNLDKGNKLKKSKSKYNISSEERLFKSIIKSFEGLDFNEIPQKPTNKKIIFICGMPRSGTTLIEQIIASHKDVNGAGELSYLQSSINKNFIQDYKIIKQKLIDQTHSENNKINNEYFEMLSYHKFSADVITDKAPQNFRWIGFIKIFFPNSKVIHCNRNAKDNCLSLFKNNFASKDMNWACDQEDIAEYYNLYQDLINFWNKKIPNFIYNANYEKIVENQEKEIKKLIDFCDLDWDPACLKHHENKKTPIQTVSVVQARSPIYKTSLNSSIGFSKYLQKLYSSIKNY